MKHRTRKEPQTLYGEHYQTFLGLIEKMEADENVDRSFWIFKDLTRKEIALLNGFIVNTGNYEQFHLNQTLDLHSLEVVRDNATQSNHPIFDLGFYCQNLDCNNGVYTVA